MGNINPLASMLPLSLCCIGLSLLLSVESQQFDAPTLPTAWRYGITTNYGSAYDSQDPNEPSAGTKEGSCGYGLLDKTKFPYWSVGALSQKSPYYLAGPQFGCGECFEVQCIQDGTEFAGRCNADPSARSLTMQITDSCPECDADHLDLQAQTFNKIAPMAIGRISTRYRRVECVPPSGLTISVDTNQGTGSWIRMTVQKVAGTGSVSLVQIRGDGSAWQNMNNEWGASWELGQSPMPPLDLRIVSSDGTEVTAFGFIDASGEKGELPVGVNFATKKSDPSVTPITTLPGLFASDLSGAGEAAASKATATITSSLAGGTTTSTFTSSSSGPATSSNANQIVSAFEGPTGDSPSPPPAGASPSPPPIIQPSASSPPPTNPPASTPLPPPPRILSMEEEFLERYAQENMALGLAFPAATTTSPPPPVTYSCDDTPPPGTSYTCYQQKQWGACYSSWMVQSSQNHPKGYCAKTCGRC